MNSKRLIAVALLLCALPAEAQTVRVRLRSRIAGIVGESTPVYGPIPIAQPMGSVAIAAGTTIQAVVDGQGAGTIYWLQAGTHREQSITPKNNDQFVGAYGSVLKGSKVLTDATASGSDFYFANQTQQGSFDAGHLCRVNPTVASGWNTSVQFPRCNRPDDVFLDGTLLIAVDALANLAPGKVYFDYAADRIYLRDDPAGRTVEAAVTVRAFGGSATGVTLNNLTVQHYAAPAQSAAIEGGSTWTLTRVDASYNHGIGIDIGPGRTILNSRAHHNGQLGLGGSGDGTLIDFTEVSYNNAAGYDDYWEAGGTKFTFTDGLTVRRSWFHHNSGPGLWDDIDNSNILYEYNVVEYNFRYGIFHEISFNAIIQYNTVRYNGIGLAGDGNPGKMHPYWVEGAGIGVVTSTDTEVRYNTLTDNWQGIMALDDHRGSSIRYPGTTWTTTGLNVHHNTTTLTTHFGDGGGRTGLEDTSGEAAFGAGGNNHFEDNTYVLPE